MWMKLLVGTAGVLVSLSALAVDAANVVKSIELKDGSTVYLFKDGKMGMESKYGKAIPMEEGHVMETKDGQRIIMIGNEVARMHTILSGAYVGVQ